MSWFLVVSTTDAESAGFRTPSDLRPLQSINLPGLLLHFGGADETCLVEYDEERGEGWGVVGVGIDADGDGRSIMDVDAWRQRLSDASFDPVSLDGHFVALRWKDEEVEFFCDQLGLRTFYYCEIDNRLVASTRLDWTAGLGQRSEIDLNVLGSRWLMYNQFSTASPVRGIVRAGQAGYLKIVRGRPVARRSQPFGAGFTREPVDRAIRAIESLVGGLAGYHHPPSLALSGGLDSRMLLAVMLKHLPKEEWRVHTLGDPTHPDVIVGREIAGRLDLEYHHIGSSLPDPDRLFSRLQSYAAQTQLIEFASTVSKLHYGEELARSGHFAVDGGFGEIGRRSLFKRFARFGRRALYRGDVPALAALLRYERPAIFRPEVLREMERGAVEELRTVIDGMPSIREIGPENYVDLFALRTRIPNYGGPEQARVDAEVLNLMPLLQPSYVRAVLKAPLRERIDGRFYNSYIREVSPMLTGFPLVKGRTTYPFGLSATSAWVVTKLRKGKSRSAGMNENESDLLFAHLRDHVLDLLHSTEVQTNPLYDLPAITRSVEAYYRGEREYRPVLDWWLVFELWWRSLSYGGNKRG